MSSNTVYRPNPDKDFYVVWSDNVDRPMAWGTRSEMVEHLMFFERQEMERRLAESVPREIEQRLSRADASGTSSMIGRKRPSTIRYEASGSIPMERVEEFLATWNSDGDTFDETMVVPFDDEDDD